ncbi:MAG: SPOR domain-containing protein [Granulosicoccus sp.]
MGTDSFDEDDGSHFRQRLWGAAVLIAIAVIVLPLLLDGAGSESQFRRVERLREEPPRIVDPAQPDSPAKPVPEMRAVGDGNVSTAGKLDIKVGEDDPPDYMKAEKEVRETLRQNRNTAPLTAWVVQAGSFREENNAIAVRDRLRRAGFASFVRDRESSTDLFRVLVGPMISESGANTARDKVIALLGRDAIVLSYP